MEAKNSIRYLQIKSLLKNEPPQGLVIHTTGRGAGKVHHIYKHNLHTADYYLGKITLAKQEKGRPSPYMAKRHIYKVYYYDYKGSDELVAGNPAFCAGGLKELYQCSAMTPDEGAKTLLTLFGRKTLEHKIGGDNVCRSV